jgi:uncharacterized membrane protein YfcA
MVDWHTKAKMLTRIGVTIVVIAVCAILILGKYPDDHTKWAFGMVGVVIGYWLK